MKEVIKYVADDGMEFITRQACQEHEEIANGFIMFDDAGERLSGNSFDDFDISRFLYVKTLSAAQHLYNKYHGWTLPWRDERNLCTGFWEYNDEEMEWKEASYYIEAFSNILKEL